MKTVLTVSIKLMYVNNVISSLKLLVMPLLVLQFRNQQIVRLEVSIDLYVKFAIRTTSSTLTSFVNLINTLSTAKKEIHTHQNVKNAPLAPFLILMLLSVKAAHMEHT